MGRPFVDDTVVIRRRYWVDEDGETVRVIQVISDTGDIDAVLSMLVRAQDFVINENGFAYDEGLYVESEYEMPTSDDVEFIEEDD